MFKLKSIALFVSAALLVPGVYAANGTVRNTTTIDDHSVISSFTEVISGDSLIVDGSAVFNYESTYALPGAIYIYGNADLGNGSKINFSRPVWYDATSAYRGAIMVRAGAKLVAENLTLESSGFSMDGIDGYGDAHIELKGTTNIIMHATQQDDSSQQQWYGIGYGSFVSEPYNNMSLKAEDLNITFETNGLDDTDKMNASGISLGNNEGTISLTGKTNIDLQTKFDGDLTGVDLNSASSAIPAKLVYMNDVNVKLRSDVAYKTTSNSTLNKMSGVLISLAKTDALINKLNIDLYGNQNVNGADIYIDDDSQDTSGMVINDAYIHVAGGEKAALTGLTVGGKVTIGNLKVDSEGGKNTILLTSYYNSIYPYRILGDVILGSQKAYDTVSETLYAIDGSVTLSDNKLVSWGRIYAAGSDNLITINTRDNSYIFGDIQAEANGQINLALNGSNSRWDMVADSNLTNLTLKDSTLNFLSAGTNTYKLTRSPSIFKTLTVNGDYTGDNGNIVMNAQLGDDTSPTDRLIIAGNTTGTTRVTVVNAGGMGERTTDGIELISVAGNSDGVFTQNGRIVAGAYDYTLSRGEGQNEKNWYLTSGLTPEPQPQPDPVDPVEPIIPRAPAQPAPAPREHAVRPEAGLYGMNLQAANTMFNTRLHDRLGEIHYVDVLTGEKAVTSLWLRNVGAHARQQDGSGQLGMQANRYLMQLGGDIAQWSSDNTDRFHLGLMAGYASQKAQAENRRNGNRADSRINGYSVGLYSIWLQDNATHEGAYVDSWAQYSWFDNTVSGHGVETEEYDAKGFTASVESGYTWKLLDLSERSALYIQPTTQVTWMGVKADEHRETNGTRVTGHGDGNVQTRLGVRLFGKGHNKLDDGKDRTFQPFVEANWIHNSKDFGTALNGQNVSLDGTRNVGELKAGVEGQLTKSVTLWSNVGQQAGDKGYRDTAAMMGIKASF